MIGKVKWFSIPKRYGYITAKDENGEEKDYFIHVSNIIKGHTYVGLEENDEVEFHVLNGKRGPMAVEATLIEKPANENEG